MSRVVRAPDCQWNSAAGSDEQAARLRDEANRLGVEPEHLALAAVADLIAAEGPDFDSAASRVLEKNREIYRRLA